MRLAALDGAERQDQVELLLEQLSVLHLNDGRWLLHAAHLVAERWVEVCSLAAIQAKLEA